MKPLISVIVPIYNIENYVERCVNSIRNQTYQNLEIILVDDGSTDCSGRKCDEFAKKDGRIKAIHKENEGPADARNAGIDMASGSLITFVDGDDFLSVNCLEYLWQAKEESSAQIACCLFKPIFENSITALNQEHDIQDSDAEVLVLSKVEALDKMLRQSEYTTSAWGKLYGRELFDGIRFPKNQLLMNQFVEDLATTYKLFMRAKSVALIRFEGYMYVQRHGSYMQSQFTKEKMVEIRVAQEQKDFIDKRFPELASATTDRLVSACFHVLFGIFGTKDWKNGFTEEMETVKGIICHNRARLAKDKSTSTKVKAGCILSYFGFKFTYKIYQFLGIRGRMIS